MKVIKPKNLALLPARYGDRRGPMLAVSAYACFSLDPARAGELADEPGMWQAVAASVKSPDIFDQGLPKPRAEVLVYGACQVPRPVDACQAVLSLGPVSKAVSVAGDRFWRGDIPGDPEPFSSMDLTWRRTYGGPDFPDNPAGVGRLKDEHGRRPVPNVLRFTEHPASPATRLTPAGFTAYPPHWPARTARLGAFDAEWRKKDFPYLPASTDPLFHMTAPEDQWLPGYFQGDEAFVVENMHPVKHRIASRLPGLRARIFVTDRGHEVDSFREVPAHADTVWLFPNLLLGVVRHCAVIRVQDEDGDDVGHLVAGFEPLDQPLLPREHYLDMIREQPGAQTSAPPPPEPPEEAPEPAPEPRVETEAPTAPAPEADELRKEMERQHAEARTQLAKAGISEPQATALVERYAAGPAQDPALAREDLQQTLDRLSAEAHERLRSTGMHKQDVLQHLKELGGLKPAPSMDALARKAEAGALPAAVAGHLQESLAAYTAFVTALEALEPSAGQGPPPPESGPPPEPETEQPAAEQAPASDLDFAGRDLTGADFAGRRLAGADFRSSILEQASFDGADLSGADFTGAVLTRASFKGVQAQGAVFNDAQAGGAAFESAVLDQAEMTGCNLDAADLSGASLAGAHLGGSHLHFALLRGARAMGLKAPKADFSHADLSGADLEHADLGEAMFSGAQMGNACLRHARASFARFNGAAARNAELREARLDGSRADERSVFRSADLRDADLSGAQWAGADMTEANLLRARLDRACLSRAVLRLAVLKGAVARNADFSKAALDSADMRGVNLFSGSLRGASLRGARVQLANLFGVDMFNAAVQNALFDGSNLKRTLLDPERFHGK